MTSSDAAEPLYPAVIPGKTVDFTLRREPHRIVIDSDEFLVPQILSGFNLRRVAKIIGDLGSFGALMAGTADPATIEVTLRGLDEIFLALMPGATGERFVARLNSQGRPADPETGRLADPEPIDLLRQAIPSLMFLLEAYGLRPTRPSSSSANGSTDGSIPNAPASSPDGVSVKASTPTNSEPMNSST